MPTDHGMPYTLCHTTPMPITRIEWVVSKVHPQEKNNNCKTVHVDFDTITVTSSPLQLLQGAKLAFFVPQALKKESAPKNKTPP